MEEETSSDKTVDTKKASQLPPSLFLPYITDLVFAALAFIVVLLATWALHNLGNILGFGWFRFFWRFFELVVISVGTLLCVLFFLKGTVKFIINLKLRLQKPFEVVGGKPYRLHPRDIAQRFGEPLGRQHLGLFFFSVVIIVAFLYFGISFAEIIRDDSDDASILTCEMLTETGPDFSEPVDTHIAMLSNYSKHFEHKHLAGLLRAFSSYDPNKVFTATSEILRNAKGSQEEIANDIWRAGEEVMLFRLKAMTLLPRGIVLHEYRKAPEGLLNDIKIALEKSREAAKFFDEKPSMENAVKSCMANRWTILLLFLARGNYHKPEVASLFTSFRETVEKCRDRKIEIYGLLSEDDPRKEFIKTISDSENRRLVILDDIKNRNMQKAIDLMWEAIDESYTRRPVLLELCKKIRSNENYSKEISF